MSNVELPGPVVPGVDDKKDAVATSQDDVDDLLSSLGF
jgi:chemotaxis protein CheZ